MNCSECGTTIAEHLKTCRRCKTQRIERDGLDPYQEWKNSKNKENPLVELIRDPVVYIPACMVYAFAVFVVVVAMNPRLSIFQDVLVSGYLVMATFVIVTFVFMLIELAESSTALAIASVLMPIILYMKAGSFSDRNKSRLYLHMSCGVMCFFCHITFLILTKSTILKTLGVFG